GSQGVPTERNDSLGVLLQKLCDRFPGLSPYKSELERLRRIRDRVQHDGMIPSEEEARSAVTHVQAFARDALRVALGMEFEEVTLVSAITDDETKAHLEEAEQAYRTGDYPKAVTKAAIAFTVAWERFRHGGRSRAWGERVVRSLARALEHWLERVVGHGLPLIFSSVEVRYALDSLVEPVELALYGIPLPAYLRFAAIIPDIGITVGGTPRVSVVGSWNPGRDDASYAIDFAVMALLRLQEWSFGAGQRALPLV
ncbi:MAG: hypothetical protein AB1609_19165, partial [Bacillota bacterium]